MNKFSYRNINIFKIPLLYCEIENIYNIRTDRRVVSEIPFRADIPFPDEKFHLKYPILNLLDRLAKNLNYKFQFHEH